MNKGSCKYALLFIFFLLSLDFLYFNITRRYNITDFSA